MLKPRYIRWRDWLKSRTIRFNTTIAALSAAVMPVVLSIDESKLVALGFSSKTVVITAAVISVASSLYNNRLRRKTNHSLAGRADVPQEQIL